MFDPEERFYLWQEYEEAMLQVTDGRGSREWTQEDIENLEQALKGEDENV